MATAMQVSNALKEISPTAGSASKLPYDIFINHFGIDTKHMLASSIYTTLEGMGLKVFLAIKENESGDFMASEIEKAMRTCFLHIPILTPNYAHSPGCLAELSFMLKNGKKILPVFYGVNRSDVRYLTGAFSDAFAEHERESSSKILEEWKRALHNVSFLSAEILKGIEDEESVLKSIRSRVVEMDEVVRRPLLLEETVHDFENNTMIFTNVYENVKIVGIVGPSGSGKTTLARELFTRKCPMMKRSSFLSQVGSCAAEHALINLQKRLVVDLLPCNPVKDLPFFSIADGKIILASRLRSIRVLLVLDGVDHVDQLDALLPGTENLACGSLIIVTSRHSNLLTSWGISSIYEMKGLDRLRAQNLLCWHAFLRSSPPDASKRPIVEECVSCFDGLPLTLKVLGQLLGRNLHKYLDLRPKSNIERLMPINIKGMLQCHFNEYTDIQETFIDIACFFIGEKKSLAIAVLEGLGWSAVHGWKRLVNECFVELDEKERIRMHDEPREFGRKLAISNSSQHYRLWSSEQIVNIPDQVRKTTRGIMAVKSQFVLCPAHEEFPTYSDYYQPPFKDCMRLIEESSRSSKGLAQSSKRRSRLSQLERGRLNPSSSWLYFLVVKGSDFTEEYATLSKDLIWLRWFDFNHPSIPPWLLLENLRVLELYNVLGLKELWPHDASPPLMLRELIISCSWGSSFESFPPSISQLRYLRKIALIGYLGDEFRIQRLPEEFCRLQSLEHLELRHCKALSSLPNRFGDLSGLQHLDLCSCEALSTLPLYFRHLTNLRYLDLSGCRKLVFRLDILEDITNLENLYLSGCLKLQELPNIKNQACLRHLHLEDTNLLDMPINIDQLSKLQVLTIGSPLLTSLPHSLGDLYSLKNLSVIDCIDLEALPPSLEHLNLLECLYIKSSGVTSLPIWQLSNLRTLKICDCPIGKLDFGQAHSMKKLKLINVSQTRVTRISISQDCCPVLEILQLEQNDELEKIKILPTTVKIIELSDCELLHDISGIDHLVNLQIFEKSGCPLLDKL